MAVAKLYSLLHQHLDQGHYSTALKVTAKLLAHNPNDALALQTRAQLLIALDRYSDALAQDPNPEPSLARAYCLYKLARTREAQDTLRAARQDADPAAFDNRAADVLQAQLNYRLGEFEVARDLFDDLAATADSESPELTDLQANSAAATAHLEFAASAPSVLASLASEHRLASTDDLEACPLVAVLPPNLTSGASFRNAGPGPSDSAVGAATAAAASKPRTRRPLPKTYEPARPASELAADRWVPKRERPSMRDALLQAKERARGKKRERVARESGMQGAADAPGGKGGGAAAQGKKGGANTGGGGGGGGAKKKGRK